MPQVQVFFATNRHDEDGGGRFGGRCALPPDTLFAGFASCDVPADPAPEGRVEPGSLIRAPAGDGGFTETVGKWLSTAGARQAIPLLFVHGFNHAFEEALTRTAKLCAWLEAGGAPPLLPLSFTWPSQGRGGTAEYEEDGRQAAGSGLALAKLVATIGALRPASAKILYMAHSMGVRATRHGMQAIAPTLAQVKRPVFDRAFLMAGDDEADVLDLPHRGVAGDPTLGGLRPIAELAREVTLGVNRDDGVVWLVSGVVINRNGRIGAAGPRHPDDLPPNVAVVDYSALVLEHGPDILVPQAESSANWVGHQYYRNAPRVRADLVAALGHAGPPATVPGRRAGRPDGSAFGEIAGRLYPQR